MKPAEKPHPTEQQIADTKSFKEWDDIMKSYGRDYQIYKTTTEDGFELTLFRILPADATTKTTKSVLFQHGLTMDAESWLQSTRDALPAGSTDIPAFLTLADEGYDVWMGNNRGTKYSNENANYPYADDILYQKAYLVQNRAKYDFSWAEMGKYDLPAMF